jgi:hypothetical protein
MRYNNLSDVIYNHIKIRRGHRMSDTTTQQDNSGGNGSFFSNLVNTVKYKAHQAVYDPNAEEFAKKQSQQTPPPVPPAADDTNKTDSTDGGDSNTVSPARIIKKVGSQTLNILKQIFIPFTALMLAMIVANEMIIYSVPIRIIFFIFVFLLCFFIPFYAIIIAIFYIFKGGYSYYINNMTNKPKQRIMPTIFSLLPITTYQPTSSLAAFLMYPFTYPKTDLGKQELPEIMNDYWEDLKKSFKSFETIKGLPIFADNIKAIKESFDKMTTIKQPTTNQSNTVNSENKLQNEGKDSSEPAPAAETKSEPDVSE